MSIEKLDQIISRLRYVQYGDYVLADDHNNLVDAVKEIRNLINVNPFGIDFPTLLIRYAKIFYDPSGAGNHAFVSDFMDFPPQGIFYVQEGLEVRNSIITVNAEKMLEASKKYGLALGVPARLYFDFGWDIGTLYFFSLFRITDFRYYDDQFLYTFVCFYDVEEQVYKRACLELRLKHDTQTDSAILSAGYYDETGEYVFKELLSKSRSWLQENPLIIMIYSSGRREVQGLEMFRIHMKLLDRNFNVLSEVKTYYRVGDKAKSYLDFRFAHVSVDAGTLYWSFVTELDKLFCGYEPP